MVEQVKTYSAGTKEYQVDSFGFLINSDDWDETYANYIAKELEIPGGLTEDHWKVIRFIRDYRATNNVCPNIYTTCRTHNLKLKDLRQLFPTGYHRGACKIAGLTYREGYIKYYYWDNVKKPVKEFSMEKIYRVDCQGFLFSADDWDEAFALCKAAELKMPESLSEKHWKVIKYLRDFVREKSKLPNFYETCEANGLEISDMELLFPDGYHRGAVKIAGLRLN